MKKFSEFLVEGKINLSEVEKNIKNKKDFAMDKLTIEGYSHPTLGYIVKYKSIMVYSDKKGILLSKLNYSSELEKIIKIISKEFKVDINFKEYDDLDKKWLAIWEKTLDAEEEIELERVKKYVTIGFSHKKMFKASAWSRAVKVMDELIRLGYVISFDFGRGKGQYKIADSSKYSIDEIGQIAYDKGIRVKPMRGE